MTQERKRADQRAARTFSNAHGSIVRAGSKWRVCCPKCHTRLEVEFHVDEPYPALNCPRTGCGEPLTYPDHGEWGRYESVWVPDSIDHPPKGDTP